MLRLSTWAEYIDTDEEGFPLDYLSRKTWIEWDLHKTPAILWSNPTWSNITNPWKSCQWMKLCSHGCDSAWPRYVHCKWTKTKNKRARSSTVWEMEFMEWKKQNIRLDLIMTNCSSITGVVSKRNIVWCWDYSKSIQSFIPCNLHCTQHYHQEIQRTISVWTAI